VYFRCIDFLPSGNTDAQLTGTLPHQLSEVPSLLAERRVIPVVFRNLVIPSSNYISGIWICQAGPVEIFSISIGAMLPSVCSHQCLNNWNNVLEKVSNS